MKKVLAGVSIARMHEVLANMPPAENTLSSEIAPLVFADKSQDRIVRLNGLDKYTHTGGISSGYSSSEASMASKKFQTVSANTRKQLTQYQNLTATTAVVLALIAKYKSNVFRG